MNYYLLRDCLGILADIWTDSDLGALGIVVGNVFYSSEYPGVAFELISITDVDPGGAETISKIGPTFVNCTEAADLAEPGCTDPTSCNYNPCATIDDGSCFYNNATIRILCNEPLTNCD